MLNKAAGIKLTYVPFAGTGSAVPALLGGHVTALMSYSPWWCNIEKSSGSWPWPRINGWTSSRRADLQGVGYDIVEGAYRGVAAPPGTPDEIIKYLANASTRP